MCHYNSSIALGRLPTEESNSTSVGYESLSVEPIAMCTRQCPVDIAQVRWCSAAFSSASLATFLFDLFGF